MIRRILLAVMTLALVGCAHDEAAPTAQEQLKSASEAYDRGALDEAIGLYDSAIGSGKLSKSELVVAYDRRANTYDDKGNPRRAIEDFDKAIALNPGLAPLYNDRGIAYDDAADYDRAIADYTRAIELKPDYAEAFNNRGTAYHHKAYEAKAIEDFSRAIQLKPTYAKAYYNRAITYHVTGKESAAKADYFQAIKLNPNLEGRKP